MDEPNVFRGVAIGCLCELLFAAGLVAVYLLIHLVWSLLWSLA